MTNANSYYSLNFGKYECKKGEGNMKYVVLVSHGQFADGLANALGMLAGKRNDLLSCGLEDGKSADEFAEKFAEVIAPIQEDDEILLLGDLIGGSPLTTACNVINEKGLTNQTRIVGGMNLPLGLTALLMKDVLDLESLKDAVQAEAKDTLKEFVIVADDDDDDDDV